MKEDSKCCNPLITVIVFLVATIVVILGALIVMRLRAEPTETVRTVEKLVMPRRNETETETTTSKSKTPTSRMTTTLKPVTVSTKAPRNVCESPECITLAHQMNNWMDPKVDPCDNFFEYACGKYSEHTDTDGGRFREKGNIVNGLIYQFLLKNKPTDSPSEKAMHLLYRKCEELKDPATYQKEAEKINGEIFKNLQKIGSWPVIDPKWDAKKFDLNKVLLKMAELHVSNFGFINVHIGELNEVVVGYLGKTSKMSKRQLKAAFSALIRTKVSKSQLKQALDDYWGLQKQLLQFSDGKGMVTLDKLKAAIPSIDVERIIKTMGRLKDDEWLKVKDDVTVQNDTLFFENRMEDIIKSTKPRVLANYLMFQLIDHEFPIHDMSSEKTDCRKIVRQLVPQAEYRVFMNNYFKAENLDAAMEIVRRTEESFIEMFTESTWMPDETKKAAIRKIKSMNSTMGHTSDYAPEYVEKRFEKLNLKSTDTIYSLINQLARFGNEEYLGFIASGILTRPQPNLLEVNAFYNPPVNDFYFLIPYLDEPFFDTALPIYAKLAIVGSVIAHEIGHGFDPNGMLYDASGKKTDWWDPKGRDEYERRSECLINMTKNYELPGFGKTMNGEFEIDEVTADVIAVDVNWRTFKKSDYANAPRMIGFEGVSIEKVLFHLTALDYCEPYMAPVEGDPHPPGQFRVNAVFWNSKAFAEAYQCPIGSPMNPVKKCELF